MRALRDNARLHRAVLGAKNGSLAPTAWRSVVGLMGNKKALLEDKTFIEKAALPALRGVGKPDRRLV